MPTETFEQYSSRYLNDPTNANSTVTTIDRLSNEGENNFAVDYPCILKRIAPAVTLGNPLITLPDDVKSIRRVTWLGWKLDPIPHRNWREVFQNASQLSRPFWYVFNSTGQNVIQLFPAPDQNLAAAAVNLYSIAIPTSFIVEYFQTPDFDTAIIPTYFRRRLLKSYVMRGCYNIEGQGQNLKASKYFTDKYNGLKEKYGNLLMELHNKPRKLVVNGISSSYFFPGQAQLPIDKFGTSVDAGE